MKGTCELADTLVQYFIWQKKISYYFTSLPANSCLRRIYENDVLMYELAKTEFFQAKEQIDIQVYLDNDTQWSTPMK